MDKSEEIRHISDTALWVAVYRAHESARQDAVFRDPFAKVLAGERGQRILAAQPFMQQNEWSFIARTWVVDNFLEKEIAEGVDAVLNLAAGLDTRPYRMALPRTLRWIEVDLPNVIEYKEERLASEEPACSLERVALNLLDIAPRRRLLERIGSECKSVVLVTEGLLVYLTRQQNEALCADLNMHPTFSHWILDIGSPGLLRMLHNSTVKTLVTTPLIFAPEEGLGFWENRGWCRLEVASLPDAAAKINRLPEFMKPSLSIPAPDPPGDAVWGGVCLFARIGQ